MFSRIILGTFNLIFFLASGLLLAFGITAKANPGAITTIFNYLLPEATRTDLNNMGVDISGIVVSNAIFMIVVGGVGIVIAGFGFIGACCLVKWMLAVYGVILILILLGEIALIIFAALYTQTFKSVIQDSMYLTLMKFKTDFTVQNNTGNGTGIYLKVPTDAIPASWAAVQIREKCCGAYNRYDYMNFTWTNINQYFGYNGPPQVPISCCKSNATSSPPSWNSFTNVQGCLQGNKDYINEQNCYDALSNSFQQFIDQYKAIAIGIAAGLGGIELILIILTFVICAQQSRDDKFV